MKKIGKFLGIIAFAAIIGFSMVACDNGTTGDLEITDDLDVGADRIIPVTSRFLANSYTGQNRVKFEFRYGDYDFFYIYLGQLRVIPLFNFPTQRHSGFESTYQATLSEQIVESVSQAVTNSSQIARSIVQTHSYTRTTGGSMGRSLSVEINAGFSVRVFSAGAKTTGTTSWNNYWNNSVTHGGSTTVQATTSRTDTVQYATSIARSTMHSRTFPLTRDMPAGYYRYTMFGVSDVYLFVVRNSSGEIHYEFREHIIPDTFFWDLNFCATNTFGKNDSSVFELDISILEGLLQRPRPELDFTGTTPPIHVPVERVTLNRTYLRVFEDNQVGVFSATVHPQNATDRGVRWETDNTNIATVSPIGVVTGHRYGKTTITVTTECGKISASGTVEVLRVYRVGDRGPGGGFVFFDRGFVSNGWRFLEVAPLNAENARAGWRNMSVRGTQTGVGTGRRNTELIINNIIQNNNGGNRNEVRAAVRANEFYHNSYRDWFLPSIGELELLFDVSTRLGFGNFDRNTHWSSSHYDHRDGRQRGLFVHFGTGLRNYQGLDNTERVRPIRAFYRPLR